MTDITKESQAPLYVKQVLQAMKSFDRNTLITRFTGNEDEYLKVTSLTENLLLRVFNYAEADDIEDLACALSSLQSISLSALKNSTNSDVSLKMNFDNRIVYKQRTYKILSNAAFANALRDALHRSEKGFYFIDQGDKNMCSYNLDDLILKEILPNSTQSFIPIDIAISNIKSIKTLVKEIFGLRLTNYQVQYHCDSSQMRFSINQAHQILEYLNISFLKSDIQKLKTIFNYLVSTVEYDCEKRRHSVYDALVNKRAVCSGISSAFCLLCSLAGIPTRIVTGKVLNTNHAWNLVKIEDNWFVVDVTWSLEKGIWGKLSKYDYYLRSVSSMKTHHLDKKFYSSQFLSNTPLSTRDYIV